MKALNRYVVTFLLLLLTAPARMDAFNPLPEYMDGSMMPYDFSLCDSTVAWADSLRPVYLGYVARHGARFLSSPKKIEVIEKALYEASLKKKLTPQGERFFAMLRDISAATEGRWGLLSPVGIAEEQRLGADMARMLPALLHKGLSRSESTYVPRVVMTMYQFLHALEERHHDLELDAASGKRFDRLLRCFAADSVYSQYRDSGAWQPVYEEFMRKYVSPEPARRLLAAGFDNNKKRLRELTMSMYGLMQACRASGISAPTDEWMTPEEYRGCWLASNTLHYLRNNINAVDSSCVAATAPLVRKIVGNADSALRGDGKVVMDGYFGHAETLLPLLSVLRVPGCYLVSDDYAQLHNVWKIQEITPLGANLALILLKGDSGRIYASLRLNGRNVAPIPGGELVVPWDTLKNFWLSQCPAATPNL